MQSTEDITLHDDGEFINDVHLEASIPGAPLEAILCTDELRKRPWRQPDYKKENRALVTLASALADSPRTILQTLAETILEVTRSDSAGLSLLTTDEKRFYWPAIAGMWKPHIGGGTPRNFGPCGDVLDRNITLLFRHFERRYPYLLPVMPPAAECLLVPFYVGGKAVGTIWAIMHDDRRKFDAKDERLMTALGKVASSAYQALVSIDALKFHIAEREKAETALRQLTESLEKRVRARTEELEQRNKEVQKLRDQLYKENIALRESEDRFRRMADRFEGILEIAEDAIISIDADQRIVLFNQGAEKIFGYTQAEIIGSPLDLLLPQRFGNVHWKHIQEFAHSPDVARTMAERREVSGRRKDGSEFPAEASISKLDLGGELVFTAILHAITERKRAEERIRQDESELRQIVEAIPQLIIVLAPDGRYLYANERMLEYTGYTQEDVIAGNLRERVFHPDDVERLRDERRQALARGVPFEMEQRVRRKDGQYRWFLTHLNPLKGEQGRVIRWYATGTDIHDRKQAEERVQKENLALREEIAKTSMFEEIVGASPALQAALSRVAKVAPTDSTVLITGETGTGKELVARAIHKRSQRASRAFVSVNCAATPPSLIASELFGHEKGAFTGALQRHLGRFELAEGGTIFLDEIGELPMETQIALLHVLQEREFERVGGNQSLRADVRVIAATNRNLQAAIAAGTFRSDLFYRLNVFPIEVPPLRERKEDIRMLVEYFINRYASKAGKKIRSIDKDGLALLQSYPWPGNIRELQNVIERSVILCEAENFTIDENWLSRESLPIPPASQVLAEELVSHEKEIIEAALVETKGRVSGPSGAAAKLGIPASTLESKIKTLKINRYRFKPTGH